MRRVVVVGLVRCAAVSAAVPPSAPLPCRARFLRYTNAAFSFYFIFLTRLQPFYSCLIKRDVVPVSPKEMTSRSNGSRRRNKQVVILPQEKLNCLVFMLPVAYNRKNDYKINRGQIAGSKTILVVVI